MAKQKKPPASIFGPNFDKPPSVAQPKPKAAPKPKRGPYKIYKPAPKPKAKPAPRPVVPSTGPYLPSSPTPSVKHVAVKAHTRKRPQVVHLRDVTSEQWYGMTPRQRMNVRGPNGKPIGFAGASALTQAHQNLVPGVGPRFELSSESAADRAKREKGAAEREHKLWRQALESESSRIALGLGGLSTKISGNSLPIKWAGQIGESLAGIPMGVYQYYKALGTDAWHAAHGDFRITDSESGKLLKGLVTSPIEDIRHPLARGGYLLSDIAAVGSGGAGLVRGLGVAGRAAAAAEGGLGARAVAGWRAARLPQYAELKANALKLDVPLSRNVLARPFQRGRVAGQNVALEKGGRIPEISVVKEASAASRVGRVLRNEGQINAELGQIPARQAGRALKWETERVSVQGKTFHHTDPARGQAIGIVGIFGDAALEHPLAAAKAFVDTHKQLLRQAQTDLANAKTRSAKKQAQRDIAAQTEILDSAPAALHYLETQPQEFLDAVEANRQLSWAADRELQVRGVLPPDRAHNRLVNIRNFYGEGAAYAKPSVSQTISRGVEPNSLVGQRVIAHDRMNVGTIRSIDPEQDVAWVHFYNRQTGLHGEGHFSLDNLSLASEKGRFELPEGHAGVENPPEGSFFFSTAPKYRRGPSRVKTGAPTGPRPGEFGSGPPSVSAQVSGLGKSKWTGESMKHGFPMVGESVLDHYMGAMRLASLIDTYEALVRAGNPVRTSLDEVGIRSTSTISNELRDEMARVIKSWEDNPPTEKDIIPAKIMDRLHDIFVTDIPEVPVNGKVEGVVWVHPDFIKTFPGGDTGVWGIVKAVNNISRFGQLYLRPAYILNWLGNAIMGAGTMGATEPWHYYQGYMGRKLYGTAVDDLITTMAGESRSESYMSRTGRFRKGQERIAEGWNAVTDLAYRKANIYYWASRHGFYGKNGLLRLAEKDKDGHYVHAQEIRNITNRGRNDAVNFSNLTPFERETLKNIIYFYPWTSRATVWTARFAVEHPVKTAIGLHVGEQGAEETKRLLGPLADWAQQSGMFPVGDASGPTARTVNPASVYTPITFLQTVYALRDLAQGLATGATTHEFARSETPFLQAFAGLAGADLHGRAGGLLGLLQQQPIASLLTRSGVDVPLLTGKPGKTYPGTDPLDVYGPYVTGGLTPRTTRKASIQPKPPSKTPVQKESEKQAHWEKVLGVKMPKVIRQASATHVTYTRLQKEMKDKLGVKKLTEAQLGLLKLAILDREKSKPPDWVRKTLKDWLHSGIPWKVRRANRAIERHLHWDTYNKVSRNVHRHEDAAKARKALKEAKPESQSDWDKAFKTTQ